MTKEMYCHHELLWMIDGYEPERGTRVAGHRGYFLKGNAVLLNQAIIMYAMHWNNQRGFTTLQTPYFMNKDVMAGVAQLEDFDEELYHVTGEEGDEKYLIATSEQPICGYHMGDYFQHWLDMGTKLTNPPKIFNVNWFRTDEEGNFIWPGFGDNLRALLWALDRCEDKVSASETPLGFVPRPEDLDLTGIDISEEALNELLTVDKETWKKELEGIKDWYAKFDPLPKELTDALAKLEEGLK